MGARIVVRQGDSRSETQREYPFSTKDFEQVQQRIYKIAGISLADHKEDLVYNRIVRRLRALGLVTFGHYFEYLDSSEDESASFINAMTTNLTSFFREAHHFEYLSKEYVPRIQEQGKTKLNIWSSACSIGEEPYSIAISLLESGVDLSQWNVKIWATDIDTLVLETAKQGVYGTERVDGLSIERKRLAFFKGTGANADKVMVKPELKKWIEFAHCNLIQDWPIKEPLDVIFCRNVMIYFDRDTQNNLLERMTSLLKPGGILCIGHSETPARSMKEYKLLGRTMYQKI